MLKLTLFSLMAIVLFGISGPGLAADGATLYKTKTCFTCHGKDGRTTIMPSYPKIAGQNEQYTLQQLRDIKNGKRNNGMSMAMKGVMHLVTDEEMKVLSKYIAGM